MLPIVVYLLVGFGSLAITAREYRRGRLASKWPTTQGTVVEARIDESGSSPEFTYKPIVVYRYRVAGAEFTSSRLTFGYDLTDGSHSAAAKLIAAFPAGKSVEVRFDPEDPSQSVLVGGVPSDWLKGTAFVGVFCLGMAAISIIWPDFLKG